MPILGPVLGAAIGKGIGLVGGSGSKGSTATSTPSSMWQNMDPWARDKYSAGMQAMPATTNVGFGGQIYPSMYGPFHRAATSVFAPQGVNAQGAMPGSFGSALGAGMPWAMMAMNNAKLWAPPTGNTGAWNSMAGSDYAVGPGWY